MSSTGDSLATARQLYNLLTQADMKTQDMVDQRDEVTQLRLNMMDLYTLLTQSLGLLQRMGLGEDMTKIISTLQRTIMLLNQMRVAIHALELSSGPVGWALFGVSMASAALTLNSFMVSLDGEARH